MSKQFKARNIRDFSQRLDPWVQNRLSDQVVCRGTVKHLQQFKGIDYFDLTDEQQSIRCFVGRDANGQALQNDMVLDVAGHVTMYAKKTLLQIKVTALRPVPDLKAGLSAKVLQPSQLTSKIKTWIEKVADPYEFQVSGTVFNVRPFKKYTIFDLGDDESSIHCIHFHDVPLKNGQTITKDAEITVSAKLEVYDDARLQLRLLSGAPSGEGALIRQLKAEGLWPRRAKPMPETIGKIGLVTGDATQAYQDFTTIYQREKGQAELVLESVRVQGEAAIPEIVRAVNRLKQQKGIDVILITRGGGDADDIGEVFDDYRVAEAICHSPVFVMTAIGHASNQTFADEVADKSVASPSDAAHVLAKIPAAAQQAKKGWGIFR